MHKILTGIIIGLIVATAVPVFADDDEIEDEFDSVGAEEREDEREDDEREDDDERIGLGSGISDVVLYVTIAAIVGTIGYTGFKILSAKRPKLQKKQGM